MARVELSAAVERDLTDIYSYSFREFGEARADAYLASINTKALFLAENPNLGRPYRGKHSRVRRYKAGSRVLYYLPTPGGIRVARIPHAKMDPGRRIASFVG